MSQSPGESTWDQNGMGQTGADEEQVLPDGEAVFGAFRLTGHPSEESGTEAVPLGEGLFAEPISAEGLEELGVTPDQLSGLERLAGIGRTALETAGRYKIVLLVGAMAAGVVADVVLDPSGLAGDLALPAAAWVAAEVGWIGGAAVSLTAIGKRLSLNPLKIHELFAQLTDESIATAAKDNPMFWVGFWVNTAFAVAQGLVPPAIIFANSPPEGWTKSLIFFADLAATWLIRQGIWNATHPDETGDNTSI